MNATKKKQHEKNKFLFKKESILSVRFSAKLLAKMKQTPQGIIDEAMERAFDQLSDKDKIKLLNEEN